MTDNTTIWKSLQEHLPKRTWIPIAKIFATVEKFVPLDGEDLYAAQPERPRWKSNVRRLLRLKVRAGSVRSREGQEPPPLRT
jgi:hypothetical protein